MGVALLRIAAQRIGEAYLGGAWPQWPRLVGMGRETGQIRDLEGGTNPPIGIGEPLELTLAHPGEQAAGQALPRPLDERV